jgi:hypothetical protein
MGLGSSGSTSPIIAILSGNSGFGHSTSAITVFIRNDSATVIHGGSGHAGGTALDSTWRHVAATYSGGTAVVYVDGVAVVTTNSLTPGTITLDRTAIGALVRTSAGLFFTGAIAQPCLYTAALTQPEIEALSDRVSPRKVRPQSLVFWPPLVKNIQDLKGAATITDNGPVTISSNPRMMV